MKRTWIGCARVSAMILALAMLGCQSPGPEHAAQPHDGAELFRASCATCHGTDARGDGPMAKMLVGTVPDLTTQQFRNKLEVIQVIDGRGMRAAHGTADMPVWGWALREAERSETAVQARLEALAEYVMALQN